MCPGCRALLSAGETPCPYCGWDVALTETRRRGGLVERAARAAGGLVPLILGANVLLALVTALLSARFAREVTGMEEASLPGLLIAGIWSPGGAALYWLGADIPEGILAGEWWRVLCPVFLHGGLLHLAMNMMALRNIGGAVEEAYGTGKALAIYLLCGIAGSLASVVWFLHTGPFLEDGRPVLVPRIGASGAILGYAGVLMGLGLRIGGEPGKALWKPLAQSVGFILVLGIALSFTDSPFQIDNSAHVGGFLVGLAAARVCDFGIRARGNLAAVRAWDAMAILLVLLTVASFIPPAIAIAGVLE